MLTSVTSTMFREQYADVFSGDERWKTLQVPTGDRFAWDPTRPTSATRRSSTHHHGDDAGARHHRRARARAARRQHHHRSHLAGRLDQEGQPAGQYLIAHGVQPRDFNSYGARRGNHEVMMRGTFANVRLRNQLAPGTEGGWTTLPARTAR
jgi:aconitate hydratase